MDLTRTQIKEIISSRLTSKEGLNELLTLMMEIIMEGEHAIYLDEHWDYGNNFRPRKILYEGEYARTSSSENPGSWVYVSSFGEIERSGRRDGPSVLPDVFAGPHDARHIQMLRVALW